MTSFLPYSRDLGNGIVVCNTLPDHADALEHLQIVVFPTLADAQRFKAAHYRKHIELFPEGQFVALAGDRVVGMTTTIRLDFDFEHLDHSFEEVIQGGWLTSHQPSGAWMYGADIGTHPDFRRRGIARALYQARHDAVRHLGLAGQVTVGMMNGYGALADAMSIDAYFEEVRAGRRHDPTVSTQARLGFEIRSLLKDYLDDPTCGNAGVLIVLPADKDIP